MSKTPDLRVRPTGSASGGARAPRYGQLAGPAVVPKAAETEAAAAAAVYKELAALEDA